MLDKETHLLSPDKVTSGTSSGLAQAGTHSNCTSPPFFVEANPRAAALLPDDLAVRFSAASNLPPSRVCFSAAQWFSSSFGYNTPNRFSGLPLRDSRPHYVQHPERGKLAVLLERLCEKLGGCF